MNNFFEGLMTEPSQFIMLACVVAFILGIILGWLIWGRKAAILGREAKKLRKELDDLKKEHAELKEKYTVTDDELKKATEEVASLNGKNRQLIIEKGQLQSNLIQTEKKLKEAEEDLAMAGVESTFFINEMATKLAKSRGEEVRGLLPMEVSLDRDGEIETELDEVDKDALIKALAEKLASGSEDNKDNLKKINGVGPVIETKLNELGIYTYEQVSQLDDELIDKVNKAIEFFPDRMKRDNWVGQAAALHKLKLENPDALLDKKVIPSDPTDLKIIEGIGPKVSELLKQNGINNWSELADASAERLMEILLSQGSKFQMMKPDSWPKQAALARDGKWDELEALQDALTAGR